MMTRNVFILAALLLSLAFINTVFADDVSDKTVAVEAEGSGSTKMEALQAAWMEAVRKGVGMYMSSKTEAVDDNLTEQVVLHSRGQVNSYSVISENKENDIWNVRIKANIDKDILQETAEVTQTNKLKLDGKDLAAAIDTKEKKAESQRLALAEVKNILNLVDILDYSANIEKFNNDKGNDFYFVKFILSMNLDKWLKQVHEAEKVLDRICSKKIDVNIRKDYSKVMLDDLRNYTPPFKDTFNWLIRYSTDTPRILDNIPNESICIFKSIGKSKCYLFEKGTVNDILYNEDKNRYLLQFKSNINDGLDSQEVESKVDTLTYPRSYNGSVFVYPCFGPGNSYFMLQYNQKLDLTAEQLVKNNEITTSYTLVRDDKE